MKKTLTKKDIIDEIARTGKLHPDDVKKVVYLFFDVVIDALASGNRLEFRDFCILDIVLRKQKVGRNPKKASQVIIIPEAKVVKFSPGKRMKEAVDNKQNRVDSIY